MYRTSVFYYSYNNIRVLLVSSSSRWRAKLNYEQAAAPTSDINSTIIPIPHKCVSWTMHAAYSNNSNK